MNVVIAGLLVLTLLALCGVPWQINALLVRTAVWVWAAVGVIQFLQSHVIVYTNR